MIFYICCESHFQTRFFALNYHRLCNWRPVVFLLQKLVILFKTSLLNTVISNPPKFLTDSTILFLHFQEKYHTQEAHDQRCHNLCYFQICIDIVNIYNFQCSSIEYLVQMLTIYLVPTL